MLPLFGCLTSSASVQLYGVAYWNPPDMLLRWLDDDYNSKARAAVFFAGVGLVICQLAINTIDVSRYFPDPIFADPIAMRTEYSLICLIW